MEIAEKIKIIAEHYGYEAQSRQCIEEMAELIGMADKIIIMKDFRKSGEVMRAPELKETDIIEYMI